MTEIIIRDQIKPEDIALIIDRHRVIYGEEFGFDQTFADYVTETLTEGIEHLWIAEWNGKFAGCIGVVEADTGVGQLRWLLVEPEARGNGVGKALMLQFLDFSQVKKYKTLFLWTVNKLSAARVIYERFGFQLREQKPEKLLWGQKLIEQRWDLSLGSNR